MKKQAHFFRKNCGLVFFVFCFCFETKHLGSLSAKLLPEGLKNDSNRNSLTFPFFFDLFLEKENARKNFKNENIDPCFLQACRVRLQSHFNDKRSLASLWCLFSRSRSARGSAHQRQWLQNCHLRFVQFF